MKKVLIVADLKGWIFERHAIEIQKRLSHKYDITIGYCRGSNVAKLSEGKDLIYIMDPMPVPYRYPKKTIVGIRAEWLHKNLPDREYDLYRKGLPGNSGPLKDNCAMIHVVNKNQYDLFKLVVDKPLLLVQHGVNTDHFNRLKYARANSSEDIVVGLSGRRDSPNKKGFKIVAGVCNQMGLKFRTSSYGAGKLTMDEMPNYYNQIDVYVCMSQTEGLCNTIMEAGAMGIPVISTRSGAATEMIRNMENGILIDRDPFALMKALEMMKNHAMRRCWGEELNREMVENWSWDVKIKEFENMFEVFLNEKE